MYVSSVNIVVSVSNVNSLKRGVTSISGIFYTHRTLRKYICLNTCFGIVWNLTSTFHRKKMIGGQGSKLSYIITFGSLFAASIVEMYYAIAAHILAHGGRGQTRIGRFEEHCKTVLQRGLSRGDSEVRRGKEHPTVILIMENFNPIFHTIGTTLRQL